MSLEVANSDAMWWFARGSLQGDVEAVARQSPKELCRLIEQISGCVQNQFVCLAVRA